MDTIEMLEAIGCDAALRYASTVELNGVLERAHATKALRAAAENGDARYLDQEFGGRKMFQPQSIQTFFERG